MVAVNFPRLDKKSPFVQLLEAVHEVEGLERLRFTSPHPIGFRDDLIDAISRLPKLAEHVHLPLQSGSNKILKAMHRAYTAEKYMDLVGQIRRARSAIAITTDIIVGFPAKQKTTTGRHVTWSSKSNLITRLCFAIHRGAILPPRRCRIKSMSTSNRSAIKICWRS